MTRTVQRSFAGGRAVYAVPDERVDDEVIGAILCGEYGELCPGCQLGADMKAALAATAACVDPSNRFLYTAERGKRPKIQLWMRTAKQKRVVAFRTYLRTLLHEVGHHIDFALLRGEIETRLERAA